jgi:cyclopropane fatty-acyl-phospholipid synthase-like methyltransferase
MAIVYPNIPGHRLPVDEVVSLPIFALTRYFQSMSAENTALTNGCCDFAACYEVSRTPAMRALERDVLGCDYGGTSWTTRSQADQIAASLDLGPGAHLLDIGSGSGWPGLFLGAETGCDVTLLDIPLNALKLAAERAADDQLSERVSVVAASGAALPFENASFDRLSHSDVLCCLPEKRQMLQECRRVMNAGGLMNFSVILPAPGLSAAEYQEAIETGPPFVDAPEGYERLLQVSGWEILDRMDVSAEYQKTLQRLVDGMKRNATELQEVFGDEFAGHQQHRQDQIDLVRRGVLQREVIVTRAI